MPCTSFESIPLGSLVTPFDRNPIPSNTFHVPGGEFWARDFLSADGKVYIHRDDKAEIISEGYVGGTGNEMLIGGVTLCFGVNSGNEIRGVKFRFKHLGGHLNLWVNNHTEVFGTWTELNGKTVGGVLILVNVDEREGGNIKGIVELFGNMIDQEKHGNIGIGGQEFFVDDFCWIKGIPDSIWEGEDDNVRNLQESRFEFNE